MALDPEPGGQVLEEHGVGGPVDCLAAGPRAQGELLLQILRRQHGHTALADLGLMSDQSKSGGAGAEREAEECGQHRHGGLHTQSHTLHQALAGQELLGLPDLKCDLLGILDNTVLLEFKPTTFTFSWFKYVL